MTLPLLWLPQQAAKHAPADLSLEVGRNQTLAPSDAASHNLLRARPTKLVASST